MPTTKAAMLSDLERSGLSIRDAKRLNLTPLEPNETEKLVGAKVPSYVIPYANLDGTISEGFRIRLLAEYIPFGADKPIKYLQRAGTAPQLYYAATAGLDWQKVAADADVAIVFTEGEKKAAAACSRGIITVALGGVWNWRQGGANPTLLEDFAAFDWLDRQVLICYDSDAFDNAHVFYARNALAHALFMQLGADVWLVDIRPPKNNAGNKKIGLDDFLVDGGKWADIANSANRYPPCEALRTIDKVAAYITSSGAVYHEPSAALIASAHTLRSMTFPESYHSIQTGEDRWKEVASIAEWMRWPHKRRHANLTYAPGEDNVTKTDALNLWRGWGVDCIEGDTVPWGHLLDYVFEDVDPKHRHWFEQWCAYPVQYPGTKLYTAVLLHGSIHGTGKSLIGDTLRGIYGDINAAVIFQDQLHGTFNGWLARRQFVMGEELTGGNSRADADKLKTLVTAETLMVNEKYQPEYVLPNCCNMLLTSNHPNAVYVERQDRRFFVHEVQTAPLPDKFYQDYRRWLKSKSGLQALYHHLKHHISVRGFDPRAAAPRTEARDQMVGASMSNIDSWVAELMENPAELLAADAVPLSGDLFTLDELALSFSRSVWSRGSGAGPAAIGNALRRHGIRKRTVTIGNGKTEVRVTRNLWPIRHTENWMNRATPTAWAEHYLYHRGITDERKY